MSTVTLPYYYSTILPLNTKAAIVLLTYGLLSLIAWYAVQAIHSAFFGHLSRFPGPLLRKFSQLPWMYTMLRGLDNQVNPALHATYGPVVRLSPTQLSFATGQEAWNEIYGFGKADQVKPFKSPYFYDTSLFGVNHIVKADDAAHRRQRKVLSHGFSDLALREQHTLLKGWAEKMKAKIQERSADDKTLDMAKIYSCTTFDVMADLTFGEDLNMLEEGEYSDWATVVYAGLKNNTVVRVMKSSPVTRFILEHFMDNKTFRASQWRHFENSKARVEKRMSRGPTHPDLWSRVVATESTKGTMSEDEKFVNASLFMGAGTETTSTLLSGLTYHLLLNPDVMDKLTAEIRSNLSGMEDMALEKLARLKYMNACLHEALRIYPPVPSTLPRQVPKGGMTICGTWIPEDTTVGIHQLATNMSPRNFTDPTRFAPERWMRAPGFENDDLGAAQPFSVGPRNCLGKNLAWHEMRLLCATVFLHFDLKLARDSASWGEDQRVWFGWSKGPLWCSATPA